MHEHKPRLGHKLVQLLHINLTKCVRFVGNIVAHGHIINNIIYINPFLTSVIIFEFVMAQMFHVIYIAPLLHVGIVRILPLVFFDSGQEDKWLSWYPKCMPITSFYGLHPPNPP